MSAEHIRGPDLLQPVTVQAPKTTLSLPASSVRIRKSGIEFKSQEPLPIYAEMTVALELPREPKKINCTGVIVACNGTRHTGYIVAMLFTGLSRQAQARLEALSFSSLA